MLEKTNRINQLFEFYHSLLTEKQRIFLTYYYHDDYSLGEIAEVFSISRQAVYEHIKRAEHMLETYEDKLNLCSNHLIRVKLTTDMMSILEKSQVEQHAILKILIQQMINLDT